MNMNTAQAIHELEVKIQRTIDQVGGDMNRPQPIDMAVNPAKVVDHDRQRRELEAIRSQFRQAVSRLHRLADFV